MKVARVTVRATAQGLCDGFHGPSWAGGVVDTALELVGFSAAVAVAISVS